MRWIIAVCSLVACTFAEPPKVTSFTLTVDLTGTGPGHVTGSGIDCATGNAGTCVLTFRPGDPVMLSFTADAVAPRSQNLVDGWGGACASAGTSSTCEFVMDSDQRVTFGFRLQHEVSVTITSTTGGQGAVRSTPDGLICASGSCTGYFDAGADLRLEATPVTVTDRVMAVSGDCSTMPCVLASLAGPRAVSVTFERTPCVPSSEVCTIGQLTQCDANGQFVTHVVPNGAPDGTATTITMHDYPCPLGCHASGTRCNDIDAANGLNAALDSAYVSPTGVDVEIPRAGNVTAGVARIDTSSFDAATGTTLLIDADGAVRAVPAMVVVQGASLPDIMVLTVRSLSVRAGSTLKVAGLRALAVASHFDVVVDGTIDLAGSSVFSPRPGGCQACDGLAGLFSGGGGGSTTTGGSGSEAASNGGAAYLDRLRPLRGGGGGGDTRDISNGGGALQLVSRVRVTLGTSSLINLSGGGGRVSSRSGALGGGAGGGLLVQAPGVRLAPGAVVAGRGGSGAATSASGSTFIGVPGNDGPTSGSTRAAGVTCSNCGTSGFGAIEGGPLAPGNATGDADSGAGGGGALGQCTIENASGALTIPSGVMRIFYVGTFAIATR